ncbi:MAG: hypothetical protein P4L41_02960 [Flavipsychrobacter sp.]|nr:hypothetical protein [Flavipsychrobacter sp.]
MDLAKWCSQLEDGATAVGIDVANSENGDKACEVWGTGNKCFHVHEFKCPNASNIALNMVYDDMDIEYMNMPDGRVGHFQ